MNRGRSIANGLIAGGALGALAFACAVEDVKASSYNQSCKADDDCIAVLELVANGGDCRQPCAAINKRDQDRYKSDFEEESPDCASVAAAECSGAAAVCDNGTCSLAGAKDASPE